MTFQKHFAALRGPIVWLLEGPVPILYSSFIDFMIDDVFLLIPFLFSEVQIYDNTDNCHYNPGK